MHTPVLPDQALNLLAPAPGRVYADATAGLGGHAAAIAPALGPDGTIILNDLDPANLDRAEHAVRAATDPGNCPRIVRLHGNFADLPRQIAAAGLRADMLLTDLGFASPQVDDPSRGFSFKHDGPLDMRLDPAAPVTAAELVATLPEDELAQIIRDFGEERHARAVARKIVAERNRQPITTTGRLAQIVRSVVRASPGAIDPATRTFQALRIAVNDEIGSLESLLASIAHAAARMSAAEAQAGEGVGDRGGRGGGWLAPEARIVIISFHSLEDRPVKHRFAEMVRAGTAEWLARGVVRAGDEELARNVRSRSAKLRAIRLRGA